MKILVSLSTVKRLTKEQFAKLSPAKKKAYIAEYPNSTHAKASLKPVVGKTKKNSVFKEDETKHNLTDIIGSDLGLRKSLIGLGIKEGNAIRAIGKKKLDQLQKLASQAFLDKQKKSLKLLTQQIEKARSSGASKDKIKQLTDKKSQVSKSITASNQAYKIVQNKTKTSNYIKKAMRAAIDDIYAD